VPRPAVARVRTHGRWVVAARLVAVCSGPARTVTVGGRTEVSAIDKQPRRGRIAVTADGLAGDDQADRAHHGGVDQALYAYGQTDVDHWRGVLARDLPPGAFGENLRIEGVDVSAALVGERWAIGPDLRVEVTGPRIPCRTFAAFWDVPDLIERFLAAGRPGAYLRVLGTGTVAAGDPVVVTQRPDHDLTVAEVARIVTRDRGEAPRLLAVDGVAARIRAWAEQRTAPTTV
jgi:MOSC domain-containing protein YiiM